MAGGKRVRSGRKYGRNVGRNSDGGKCEKMVEARQELWRMGTTR